MSIEVLRLLKVRAQFEPMIREHLMKNPLQFLQDYDLTDVEKRQLILPHFEWFIENKLAALSYPESEDALNLLWQLGIRAVLNLAEQPLPEKSVEKIGITVTHIPIVDFTAPTLKQIGQATEMIANCLAQEIPVAVHCVAGLGRTGTILACYLVKEGKTADEAIKTIRNWRFGSIETPEQELVVHDYEDMFKISV